MALSSKALQKKRAKKAQKRKEVKKQGAAQAQLGLAPEWLAAARAPVAEVFTPVKISELGLGSVWFSRRLPDGRYALSVFLLDTFCLGVKNVMFGIDDADQYRERLKQFLHISEEEFVPRDPAYARKLVESALAYARGLGFDPHPDYRIAKMIFGDVDASACEEEFAFGRDGKPFYVPGPGDSPTMQRRVMKQLEKLDMDPFGLLVGPGFDGD